MWDPGRGASFEGVSLSDLWDIRVNMYSGQLETLAWHGTQEGAKSS